MPSFPPRCTSLNLLTHCGNCNKEAEPFTLKMCTACRSVCYCDVDCQKTHRKHHKHECNNHAQKIKAFHAAYTCGDEFDDELLFQPIPPQDDCPICKLPLPIDQMEMTYYACCGNRVCSGCCDENFRVTLERGLIPSCAFCREPNPTSYNETVVRTEKRMEMNDTTAIFTLSQCYERGARGRQQDPQRAFKLCMRAAELGHSKACGRAACYYSEGVIVPKDMTKVMKYNNMSVEKGGIIARHNLGFEAIKKGNYRLASRHLLISAAAGLLDSLEEIVKLYQFKLVTKKEYSTALASYSKVHKDEWSIQREKAVVATRN